MELNTLQQPFANRAMISNLVTLMDMNRTEYRQKLRRDNFARVRARYHTNAAFSDALGEGFSPSYVSQLLSGHRGIGDEVADKIEQRLQLDPGYLDQKHDEETVSGALSLSSDERDLLDSWKLLLAEERSDELLRIRQMAQRNQAVMEELQPYRTVSVSHRREKKSITAPLPGQQTKRKEQ